MLTFFSIFIPCLALLFVLFHKVGMRFHFYMVGEPKLKDNPRWRPFHRDDVYTAHDLSEHLQRNFIRMAQDESSNAIAAHVERKVVATAIHSASKALSQNMTADVVEAMVADAHRQLRRS